MNNVKATLRLNEAEIQSIAQNGFQAASWHDEFKHSAVIFIGGLPYDLTEGDVVAIFSQYGEPVDIHLKRDPDTGKSKGFGWLKYADQRSTVLSVDNLNGITVLGRTIRVQHVKQYRRPELHPSATEEEQRRHEIETYFGGNAAPEVWGKSFKEVCKIYRKLKDAPAALPEASKHASQEARRQVSDDEDPMKDYLEKRSSKRRK